MTKNRNFLLILTSLVLLVPVNIYGIGDWIRCGIQWGLVRYQQTLAGDQLLSFTTDLCSVAQKSGISGSSAAAVLISGSAVILLIVALILNIVALYSLKVVYTKAAAGFTIVAGLGFLVADIIQYGVFLHGAAGWCIPIGIPAILVLGIWGYRTDFDAEDLQQPVMPVASRKEVQETDTFRSRFGKILHTQDIISLVILSVLVKAVVFFAGMVPNISFTVITGDLTLYHWYATTPFLGIFPYVNYYVPYPQLFFVPVFLAVIPVLGMQNPVDYFYSFSALMVLVDTATLICVYSLACRFFGRERAFLSGLLYVTAIAAAYFVPIEFDAVPTFLMVFSLWLFLSRKTVASYLSATAATLTKWFPACCFPYYLVYAYKKGQDSGSLKKSVGISVLFAVVVIAPFLILNSSGFLNTYQTHFSRAPEIHSLIYYLDTVSSFVFHVSPFDAWSLPILVIGELALLWWYFRYLDKEPLTLVYLIFMSLFFFVLTNKVFSPNYLIWLTPFLALILMQSPRRILLFYLAQVIVYLETPVLFNIVYAPLTFGVDPHLLYTVFDRSLPSLSFIFYTIKFGIFFVIFWVCFCDLKKNHQAHDSTEPPAACPQE
jgi:hypothetical protein